MSNGSRDVKAAATHLAKAADQLRRQPNVEHVEEGSLWALADRIAALEDSVSKFF